MHILEDVENLENMEKRLAEADASGMLAKLMEADASEMLVEVERKIVELLMVLVFGKVPDSFDLKKALGTIDDLLTGIREKAEFAMKNGIPPVIYGQHSCAEQFEEACNLILSKDPGAIMQVLNASRYGLGYAKMQAEYTALIHGMATGWLDAQRTESRQIGKTGWKVKRAKMAEREAKEAARKKEGERKRYTIRALIAACRKYERKLTDQKEDSSCEVARETIKEIHKDGYFFDVTIRNFVYRLYPKWKKLGRPSKVADFERAEQDYKRKKRK